MKGTIYAGFGYEPNPDVPLEEQWKPEIAVAVEAFEGGLTVDNVFTETFQWLVADIEKSSKVEWTDELEEALMLKQGRTLAKEFDNQFGDISAEPLVSMRTNQAPVEIKVVNFVRTKKPKMQVLSAPEPKIPRTLAICNSVIASINAGSFYPNAKNVYGCKKCGYSSECEKQW